MYIGRTKFDRHNEVVRATNFLTDGAMHNCTDREGLEDRVKDVLIGCIHDDLFWDSDGCFILDSGIECDDSHCDFVEEYDTIFANAISEADAKGFFDKFFDK